MLRLRTKVTVSPTASAGRRPPRPPPPPRGRGRRTGRRSRPRRRSGRRARRPAPRPPGPARTPGAGDQGGRLGVGARVPGGERMPVRTISAPVPALAFSSVRSGNTDPGSSRPRSSASDRSPTGNTRAGSSQRSGAATNSGYTVRRGARRSPGLGHRPQPVEGGPRPLGVHVVGGHRRHAAPVVDAGVEQHAEVVGQVGRAWTWTSGGRTRRARAMASRCSSGGHGAPCMAVPGLGRKFWTITSCTWPWRRCEAAMASRAASRSARLSPMPTRMPVVKGMPRRPAASSAASRRSGVLSGSGWAAEVAPQGLDHHPLAGRHRPQLRQLVLVEGAGVGVGEQARAVHQPAHLGQQ